MTTRANGSPSKNLLPALPGKRKIKRGPFAGLAIGPGPAAVTLDDALNNGQTYAAAVKLFRSMQPLKRLEEFVRVFWIEAHAIVAHVINGLAQIDMAPNLDSSRPWP